MIITMQGDWTVTVKSKHAAYKQRFIVYGATTNNGEHPGNPGYSVSVTGKQWSIAIQNKPGANWVASDTKLTFPKKEVGKYVFDILSNDAGGDQDFNDLVLTCSSPAGINDFVIYGNVTLYSGNCSFNPCRQFPWVIETDKGFLQAWKNPRIRKWIEKYYPERVPGIPVDPNPPDPPPYFKPIVFDLGGEAMKPRTTLTYMRKKLAGKSGKAAKENIYSFDEANFELMSSSELLADSSHALAPDSLTMVKDIGGLLSPCFRWPGKNLTISFEEYDRSATELAGGAYTGDGNRRLLGDTITDMNGNYIFRFSFNMMPGSFEDATDVISGEDINKIVFPDVIVKIIEFSPYQVVYESAPYYNIPNLKRINLCLPSSVFPLAPSCFNGSLIGSLGNVFLGGNQNTAASLSSSALERYGYANELEPDGKISVSNSQADFEIDCSAWHRVIDVKGCMYDISKSKAYNKIEWYTLRIKRAGTSDWIYVSQNYKHPRYSRRHEDNYHGDDVGPFYPNIGHLAVPPGEKKKPAYINIQREAFAENVDWEFSNITRYMQLNTRLYDTPIAGVRTPGTFYLRVDGYDKSGNLVSGATDLIALYIHNNGLNFNMQDPVFTDPGIVDAGCRLFRLTDAQLKTMMNLNIKANDPYGFVDYFKLTMRRCPQTQIALNANIEGGSGDFNISSIHEFPKGENVSNTPHACPGYRGTIDTYAEADYKTVEIYPPPSADGWIKAGENFTVYTFHLEARQRVTNGYRWGLSHEYDDWAQIMVIRDTP